MAKWCTHCGRQDLHQTIQPCYVSEIPYSYSVTYTLTLRKNAGGSIVEETSCVSKEAQLRARQELATRTGDTDSEEDGSASHKDDDDDDDDDEGEYDGEHQGLLFPEGSENNERL